MNSYDAVKRMRQSMIPKAFEIYNNLDETQRKEFIVMDAVLNCCHKISKHKMDSNAMTVVHQIRDAIIDNNESVNAKNRLINIFSQLKDVNSATKVFDSIPKHKLNIVSICAMMKCCIDNHRNDKAILLHEQYSNSPHNDLSNLLFIKACANCAVFDRGKQFINSEIKNVNDHSIKFINTLIDFYGKSGDIEIAMNIFESIAPNKKDIVSVTAMMKCFMTNNNSDKAVLLHEQYSSAIHDDVSNLLFIKACANSRNYEKGKHLINSVFKGTNKHSIEFVTTLIDFCGKIGNVEKAVSIFKAIAQNRKSIVTVGAMMKCLIDNNDSEKAILLYEQYSGRHNDATHLLFIKACINVGDFDKGKQFINSTVINVQNCSIEFKTTLIDFYGKWGSVEHALHIFNRIPSNKKDIKCIGAMMKCFIENNKNNEAMRLYELQCNDGGITHSDVSNLLYIKACANNSDYEKGKIFIEETIFKNANCHSMEFMNTLVDFYRKSGDIDNALHIFDKIPSNKKHISSVSSMMKFLINNDKNEKAIILYEQCDSDMHNDVSNLLFIKACTNIGQYQKGKQFINSTITDINNHSIQFITTLIDFYGKSGSIHNAVEIFNNIPQNERDIVCVNAMMNACNENKEYDKAILIYEQFNGAYDETSNILFIKACTNMGDFEKGQTLINSLIPNTSIELITSVIYFHCKSGNIEKALSVFTHIPQNQPNIGCVTVLMNAYNDNAEYHKSIAFYDRYTGQHNDISHTLFIKACTNIAAFDKGQTVINSLQNINSHSIEFVSTVIDFYGKCGDIGKALHIFKNIPKNEKDIISINAMMTALIDNDENEKAIVLYEQYTGQHDDVSNLLLIKACVNSGEYHKCERIVSALVKHINQHSIELINTVIDFYGKSGDINTALHIFNHIPNNKKDAISIGTIMTACNNNEEFDKTLNLFHKIKDNTCMDEYMYCMALIAAGNLVSPHQGSIIINHLNENNHISQSLYIQSAMITMHAKCNKFEAALNIFNTINFNNEDINGLLYVYASIMDGYAKRGDIQPLLSLFDTLKCDHRFENKITDNVYCIVLNGCAHSGLINEALSIFEQIKCKSTANNTNVSPHIITALIDCLGRKGDRTYLNKAENIYETCIDSNPKINYKLKMPALFSLLSSCRTHNDLERGQRIFDKMNRILNAHQSHSNAITAPMHVLLSNIYGQNKEFEKVRKIRKIMKSQNIRKKKPGISWIEIEGVTHTFMANDHSHSMNNEIMKEREILKTELKAFGHIFDASVITRELNEKESIEDHLCGHSEKLALICGLIMTPSETPLVIAKNLRVCNDCHNVMKLVSEIRNRQISVRDKNRWHIFQNGICSCHDYF